jgi:hypothetical protein
MTRIATALVAVACVAIGTGCADDRPRQSRTSVKSAGTAQSKAVVERKTGEKSEAFVITGDDDTPKAVIPPTPAIKVGKHRPDKSARPPAEVPQPKVPTFYVTGEFRTTREKARESAIQDAVAKLHDHLLQQQPAVITYPTEEMVRKLVVPHPSATESDPEFGKVIVLPPDSADKETMYKVEIALRVEPEHVRELRARERSGDILWVLVGAAALAAVLAVFFKIDAWTKGYLTSWLVLGTVGAGALVFGLLWLAR